MLFGWQIALTSASAAVVQPVSGGPDPPAPRSSYETTVVRTAQIRTDSSRILRGEVRSSGLEQLALFPNISIEVFIDRVKRPAPGSTTYVGHLPGQPGSSFLLVVRGTTVAADILTSDGRRFQIHRTAGGNHVVRELNPNAFPSCGTGLDEMAARARAGVVGAPAPIDCPDDGLVVDLLVVYTSAARDALGGVEGIEAMIALAELQTNLAYENSQITTSVRVVKTHEVDYVESGDSFLDRSRLSTPTDGFMDEVHPLRDKVSADVVSLIVDTLDFCGVAYFSIEAGNVPVPELAFNVIRADCATGIHTFGHELGHNQGCRHNRELDASDDGAFLYSHGFQEPDGAFRTMMAGDCPDGCQRILHFSNPDVLYDGLPMGVPIAAADSAHNALSINNTASNVANFRPSRDCNLNGICDVDDVFDGTSLDCNGNGLPDECEEDCNASGVPDDCDVLNGTSPDCNGNGIPDECIELEDDCNGNGVPDACDISIGASLDCTANGIPDECESDCDGDGLADVCAIAGGSAQDTNGNGLPDACEPPVLYVDANAPPGGLANGTTWADAFTDLSAALSIAAGSQGHVTEIRVAGGVYVPEATGLPDARIAAFELVDGVALLGGFAGHGAVNPDARDIASHLTVLSGDLAGDDGPDFANNEENAYHVVTASSTSAATLLEGFTIRGGHAAGNPNVVETADLGAGLLIAGGEPSVAKCTFTGNKAKGGGGGIYSLAGATSISGCHFERNVAGQGGALYVKGAGPMIADCRFIENVAIGGGGVPGLGGAMANVAQSAPTVINGVFSRNAAQRGGALANLDQSNPLLINCTMSNNAAVLGRSVYNEQSSSPRLLNCIVWGDAPDQIHNLDDFGINMPELSFSCIKGGWSGLSQGGNITLNPNFFDPLADDVTLDVVSPCVDAGNNAFVPSGIVTDLDGTDRLADVLAVPDTGAGPAPVVDMGAYEAADCNENGINDRRDVANSASSDCDENGVPDECQPDCNGNGVADPCDLASGTSDDCNGNGVPDDCEPDCNDNGVADSCDIAVGSSLDANGNGVPDECDLDCNGNGVPDDIECISMDPPQPGGSRTCATDPDCLGIGTCIAGVCYVAKNRYVSIAPGQSGCRFALRVTHIGTGRRFWVREPDDNAVAWLDQTPHYLDWSAFPAIVHVGDCPVIPVAEYAVQAVAEGCDSRNEADYSDGLILPTAAAPLPNHWADCVGPFLQVCREDGVTPCNDPGDCAGGVCGLYPGPDGYVNFNDVGAAVKAFQKVPGTSWPETSWVDLHGDDFGNATVDPPNFVVNFADVQQMVLAFQGQPYPFSDPADCP